MQFDLSDTHVTVNVRDRAALLASVGERLRNGQGFALATLNVDHLVKLKRDPEFRTAYEAQDFVTADGHPIVWLSRLGGQPVSLVTGSDMTEPLVVAAAAAGAPVALVGATCESLDRCAAALEERVPNLKVVAKISPPMGFDPSGMEAENTLEELRRSGARFCLLALGAPKQELFAARGRKQTPEIGFASVGAGVDFIAGTQTRAPAWIRRIAMEWVWRLASNPRRFARRYLDCALVLPGAAMNALRQRGA